MPLHNERDAPRVTSSGRGLGIAWIMLSLLGCDGSESSSVVSDGSADVVSGRGMDGAPAQDADPRADARPAVDAATVLDAAQSLDVGSAGDFRSIDVALPDVALPDASAASDAGPCRHLCQTDEACGPTEECTLIHSPGCDATFMLCIDRCENPANRAPRNLRCCTGEMPTAPICADGEWGCPDGSGQFESIPDGCGPGTNVAEDGVYCDIGTPLNLCAPGFFCCVHVVTRCGNNPEMRCSFRRDCDGPEDCAEEQVCCAFLADTPSPRYASACRSAADCAGEDELTTCNTSEDCPAGQNCCAERMSGIRTAICRPACLVGP
jgi:hypothetical protein